MRSLKFSTTRSQTSDSISLTTPFDSGIVWGLFTYTFDFKKTHKKKLHRVRLQDLASHSWSSRNEITRSGNVSCSIVSVS